jgi:hypothetical protein
VKTPKSPISKAMVNSIDAGEILERDTSSIFQHCAGAACRSYLYEERCRGRASDKRGLFFYSLNVVEGGSSRKLKSVHPTAVLTQSSLTRSSALILFDPLICRGAWMFRGRFPE